MALAGCVVTDVGIAELGDSMGRETAMQSAMLKRRFWAEQHAAQVMKRGTLQPARMFVMGWEYLFAVP